MKEQQNDDGVKEPAINRFQNNKAEQKISVNPNPGANENIKDKNISPNENVEASQDGSEITDGEDG